MRTLSFLLVVFLLTSVLVVAIPLSDLDDGHKQPSSLSSDWKIEVVDSTNFVGTYSSIAIDSSDNPHVSYYDETNGDLKYAAWNGTAWSIETVDTGGDGFVGWWTSIALDMNDNPHISYRDETNQTLKYARWDGSAWSLETVDLTGHTGEWTSMALDSNDNPHISYFDRGNNDLKYAWWNGTAWNTETVDFLGHMGWHSSIAVDKNDYPHISYYDGSKGDMRYAKWNGTAWSFEVVDSAGWVGWYTSIALDADGNPHVSYYDMTNSDLKYAKWTGSTWINQTVDFADDVGEFTSIALDSNGFPRISYVKWTNQDLKYAEWNGTGWSIEIVDSSGWPGVFSTSIDLDSNDDPHISYIDFDAFNGDLKYATKADIWGREIAANAGGPYEGNEGDPITFNASGSEGPEGVSLEYRWDFDGDGLWDTSLSDSPLANHTWYDDYTGTAYVEVHAPGGDPSAVEIIGSLVGEGFVAGEEQRGQSFVATFDVLTHVSGDVTRDRNEVPDGPLTLSIRSDINGSDLTSSQVDGAGMPVGLVENWVAFDVPDLVVTQGDTYYVVLHSNAGNAGYEPHVTLDAYPNGTAWGKGAIGSWVPSPTLDYRVVISGVSGKASATDGASVTVYNVAPTPEWKSQSVDGVILNPPYPEGKKILFEATVYDPGIYDTFTYDWDLGDGTILLDAGPSVTHAYGDDDIYIVVLTVTDDDGGVGIDDTPPLDTMNENPIASIDMPFCIFIEGTSPCEPIGEFTDPGWLDTHSAVWDYGDGTYETAVLTEENDPPDATGWNITSHIYGDDGVFNITFTVVDDDGGVGTAWAEAQVQNLPPSVDMNAPSTVNEGEDFVLGVTATDPGSDDIIISVDWGDGTSETETHYNNGIGPDPPNSGEGVYPFTAYSSVTHAYGDNGNFTVQVTVEDDDGGSVQEIVTIDVLNLPPQISLPTAPLILEEGEEFSLTAPATDPGSDDLEFTWSFELGPSLTSLYFNDGTGPDPPLSPWGTHPFTAEDTVAHTYGDNGLYDVTIMVSDDDGGSSTSTLTIEVVNVEPSVDVGGPYFGDENSPVEFTAMVTDPGSDDLTLLWDWGDGTTDAMAFYNDGMSNDPPKSPWGTYPFSATHTLSHVWGDNGNFTVTLTVMDDDGGISIQQTEVIVDNVAPTIEAIVYYLNASFSFRIAGEKWHNVEIHLYEDGTEIGDANITRYPGSPNEQMATLADISIDFSKTYSAVVYYTPEDDPVNGQIWGATPAWVILEYEDGEERIHHTFNVRHEDTWTWVIDDLSPYFLGHNITFMATASDPGSDDLTFTWNWGDGNSTENVYYNDGIGPDPYPSLEVNPIVVTDTVRHGYGLAGTYVITLTVTDDDGGITSYSLNLTL